MDILTRPQLSLAGIITGATLFVGTNYPELLPAYTPSPDIKANLSLDGFQSTFAAGPIPVRSSELAVTFPIRMYENETKTIEVSYSLADVVVEPPTVPGQPVPDIPQDPRTPLSTLDRPVAIEVVSPVLRSRLLNL